MLKVTLMYTLPTGIKEIERDPLVYVTQQGIELIKSNSQEHTTQEGIKDLINQPSGIHFLRGHKKLNSR